MNALNTNEQNGENGPVDLTQLKLLVRRVARTFFDGPECIVLDYLTELPQPVITDADLGTALRVGARDANKFCARLVENRLLRMYLTFINHMFTAFRESKGETKRPDGKPIPRTFYVLDYRLFLNVVKWKLMMMDRNVRKKIERDMDSHGYVCPKCDRKYTALQVQSRLVSFINALGQPDFQFVCDAHPETALDEDKNDDLVKQGNDHSNLLNVQNRPLLDLVYVCDHLKLPAYNPALVLEQLHAIRKEAREAAATANGSGTIELAGSGTGEYSTAVRVEFSTEGEAESRRARELLDLRNKNKLPEWYRFSTLTGEQVSTQPAERVQVSEKHADGDDASAEEPDDDYYKEYLNQVSSLTNGPLDATSIQITSPSSDIESIRSSSGEKRPRNSDASDFMNSSKRARASKYDSQEADYTSTDYEDEEFAHISSLGDYELTAEDQAVLREFQDDNFTRAGSEIPSSLGDDDDTDFDEVLPDTVSNTSRISIKVEGKDVLLTDITEKERDRMTPEEYAAYYKLCAQQSIDM